MQVAIIREIDCVGCAKCLPACPVDAILGAPQLLHNILTDECIGCGLCIAPCPMNCIEMIESPIKVKDGTAEKIKRAHRAKERYQARQQRLASETQKKLPLPKDKEEKFKIREAIMAAVNRIKEKRERHGFKKMY